MLLTRGSPVQANPLLWNVLKIKSDSLSRRAMQRMLNGSTPEQMCCGFPSELWAVEKPCSAARQEGITAQELVVTGARGGVHKLSGHRSCSGWMLFHFVWPRGLSMGAPCVTATLRTENGWGLGIDLHRPGKDATSASPSPPPVLLGKGLCFSQDRWHFIWVTQTHQTTFSLSKDLCFSQDTWHLFELESVAQTCHFLSELDGL